MYGLEYVRKGWSIFPCHSVQRGVCTCSHGSKCQNPGKHPRTINGVKDASNSEDQVRMWALTYGDKLSWGLACGAGSGVFAIDIDQRKNGYASLDEFESQRPDGPLQATLTAMSGGGGRHLLFAYPEDNEPLGNRTNWLPGVDVRSDGGYIILPPSSHISGGTYQWITPDWQDAQAADAPWDLLGSLRSSANKAERPGLDGADALTGIPQGERDDAIFRHACRWRRLHEKDADGGRAAVEALVLAAAGNAVPPFPKEEALAKVDQAFKQDHTDADAVWDYLRVHPFNDDGNASRLVDRFQDEVRYVAMNKTWYVWNGAYWVPDVGSVMVLSKARELTSILQKEAEFTSTPSQRQQVMRFAKESGNHGRMTSAVKVAQSDPRIQANVEDFDKQPYLLNVQNGVVDLRTGELIPHRADLMLSKIAPHEYDPDAPEPTLWLSVVSRLVRHPEDADLLHRFTGYTLTGYTREDKALFIVGPPRNGKSTIVKAVNMILGDGYCAVAHEDLLAAVGSKHDDVKSHIIGRRAVVTAETAGDQRLDAKFFKRLTGGDGINARQLYAQSHDYRPTWKLMIATNDMMRSVRRDTAITERLLIIQAGATIPREQRDPFLDDRLAAEGDAILTWMVKQAVAWYGDITETSRDVARPTTGLPMTESSLTAAQQYEDDSDPLGEWLNESCELGEGYKIEPGSAAWRSYSAYAMTLPPGERLRKGEFLSQMRAHPQVQDVSQKCFKGVRLKSWPARISP